MSHSGAALSAMKVMIVVMVVMAQLTTTSHCININRSIVSSGGHSTSSSRCNGLTATACRIAYSELDFDLEFMLDSEFSIRILKAGDDKITFDGLGRGPVSCGRNGEPPCHDNQNKTPIPPHCKEPGTETNKECYRH